MSQREKAVEENNMDKEFKTSVISIHKITHITTPIFCEMLGLPILNFGGNLFQGFVNFCSQTHSVHFILLTRYKIFFIYNHKNINIARCEIISEMELAVCSCTKMKSKNYGQQAFERVDPVIP